VLTVVISSVPTWLGDTADVGQAVAGIAALVGLFALVFQLRQLASQTKYQGDQTKNQADQIKYQAEQIKYQGDAIRASVIQGITTQMLTIDQAFIAYPQLRRFFYEDKEPIAKGHEEYDRALSVAEMLVDLIDCVVSLKGHMDEDIDLPGWYAYARELYNRSIPIQDFAGRYAQWYSDATIEAMQSEPASA
jgi:hypothetical protein